MNQSTQAAATAASAGMTPTERRAALSLATIFSLRMLGLFMILPVFSLYAHQLQGVTPALIGIAIGIYGLSQAVLQIPFGMLSDRIGRRPVIVFGMLVFALGSAVAAMSHSIGGVIMGRALQGTGAVAAVVMALAADLTREEHRTKAMAMIGTTIGMSFVASLALGPILSQWIGVPGLFWLTAVLGLFGVAVLQLWVPRAAHTRFHHDTQAVPAQLMTVLKNGQLARIDVSIFALHMMLTATFVVMPLVLRDHIGLVSSHHWYIYLPVMLFTLALMIPLVIIAEKKRRMKQMLKGSVVLLGLAELTFSVSVNSTTGMVIGLLLFFTAFNLMEAILPSYIAKVAPPDKKGTAMGAYSTSQFLGAFVGGAAGGTIYGAFGPVGGLHAVFVFCAFAAVVWAVAVRSLDQPPYLSSQMLNVGAIDDDQARQLTNELLQIQGVKEAVVVADDEVAYLKVDSRALDREALQRYMAQPAEALSGAG